MNIVVYLAIFLGTLAFVFRDDIAWKLRMWRQRPKNDADLAAWRENFNAENPEGPPMTREEVDAFKAWHAALALPAIALTPDPAGIVAAGGTRIGGPVWLPAGEAWPTDIDGIPLEFVAQLDLAGLPALPDFPERGLLQVFVGRNDVFGVDLDDPPGGGARVLWRADGPSGDGELHPPIPLKDNYAIHGADTESSPFARLDVRENGLALTGQSIRSSADPSDWRIDQRLTGQLRRPGFKEIDEFLYDHDAASPAMHHMGGHPAFTQSDFRSPGHHDDLDRTVLRLTSDDILCWGDVGEAVFLIRRQDLLARDFSRIVFHWDCC